MLAAPRVILFFGWTFLLALAPLPASMQEIPAHLAAMTARTFDASAQAFAAADPDSETGWPLTKARDALEGLRVGNWSRDGLPAFTGGGALAAKLGIGDEAVAAFLTDYAARGVDAAVKSKMEDAGKKAPTGEALFNLTKDIAQIVSDGWSAKQRLVEIEADDGRKVALRWEPERARFQVEIHDPPGGDRAESMVLLPSVLDLRPPVEGAAPQLAMRASEAVVLDADALALGRASIYGDWINRIDGSKWLIMPADGRAVEPLPDAAATGANDAALARIAEIDREVETLVGNETFFVWRNVETGAEERQERFRRLKDPWEYLGESTGADDSKATVAALSEVRAALMATLDPVANFERAPALPDAGAEGVADLTIYYSSKGHIDLIDAARFDGVAIKGREALQHFEDYAPLPESVIRQLIENYLPENWFEMRPELDTATREWTMQGKYWSQHVTYGGDDLKVKSIHSPYFDRLDLHRVGGKKAP